MTRFNTRTAKSTGKSPIKTTGKTVVNHNGGKGYLRDEKSELFLLAVVNTVGQDTFYESGGARDDRYTQLIHKVALADPEWTVKLLTWLRSEGNMRTASIVGAAEFVHARLSNGVEPDGLNRKVIDAVLQRADEPGELLAYWMSTHGRNVPKPVKRGVADAVNRLYNERSLLKYDTTSKGYRFGDVLDLVHPSPRTPWQGDLFKFAIDRRHGNDNGIPESLGVLQSNHNLRNYEADSQWLIPQRLNNAGMTWEDVLSAKGNTLSKKDLWEAMIPSMGYMALLRNLRNFDEAGISDEVADKVIAKLSDPAEVAKSRQFPFRFLNAYKAAPSTTWSRALDKALGYATKNIPEFTGKTLVLVDTSGSMSGTNYSARSTMSYVEQAALFGVSLALRGGDVQLRGFASGEFDHEVRKGGSVLREMNRFMKRVGEVGHGTDISGAVARSYTNHDRIIILTDMQTFGGWGYGTRDVSSSAPASVPIYAFNVAGYQTSAIPSGGSNRHEMGGLTDATFKTIPLLEAGRNAAWPWEV